MALSFRTRFSHWRKILRWRLKGAPLPPPHAYKISVVRAFGRRFGARTLVETGTFMGDMLEAQKGNFDRMISVELAPQLFEKARERFSGIPEIELLKGDSAALIGGIVSGLKAPALFWLDGHYSGGETALGMLHTPIIAELDAVLGDSKNHVILIDDARCFTGRDDYPTVDALRNQAKRLRPDYDFHVEHDLIRIHPSR